jgi:hypothetical protein
MRYAPIIIALLLATPAPGQGVWQGGRCVDHETLAEVEAEQCKDSPGVTWDLNFRRCDVAIHLYRPSKESPGLEWQVVDGAQVSIWFGPEVKRKLKNAAVLLELCDKFWACVVKRDARGKGAPKHCYPPRGIPPFDGG